MRKELNLPTIHYEFLQLDARGSKIIKQFLNELDAQADILEFDFDKETEFRHLNSFLAYASKILKEAQYYGSKKNFCVLAKENGKIVGFRMIVFDTTGKVSNVFNGVLFSHTRRGIATRLVKETHDYLKKMGIRKYETSVNEYSGAAIEKVVGKRKMRKLRDKLHSVFI